MSAIRFQQSVVGAESLQSAHVPGSMRAYHRDYISTGAAGASRQAALRRLARTRSSCGQLLAPAANRAGRRAEEAAARADANPASRTVSLRLAAARQPQAPLLRRPAAARTHKARQGRTGLVRGKREKGADTSRLGAPHPALARGRLRELLRLGRLAACRRAPP